MSATLSSGTAIVAPELILEYRADQLSGNVFHRIIGKASPDVSLADDGPREGVLRCFFPTAAEADAARAALATAAVWTLSDPDVPLVNMTFARRERMTIQLEEETREHWLLDIGYQEVAG